MNIAGQELKNTFSLFLLAVVVCGCKKNKIKNHGESLILKKDIHMCNYINIIRAKSQFCYVLG